MLLAVRPDRLLPIRMLLLPEVIALLEHAAQVGVREILAVGEIARARPLLDDPVWQAAARHLAEVLEESGYADSFGLSG